MLVPRALLAAVRLVTARGGALRLAPTGRPASARCLGPTRRLAPASSGSPARCLGAAAHLSGAGSLSGRLAAHLALPLAACAHLGTSARAVHGATRLACAAAILGAGNHTSMAGSMMVAPAHAGAAARQRNDEGQKQEHCKDETTIHFPSFRRSGRFGEIMPYSERNSYPAPMAGPFHGIRTNRIPIPRGAPSGAAK